MEKAKINSYQLFVLMVLFEMGSALLVPIAIEAKQDAWLAILIGMVGGMILFLIYYKLFQYYPEMLPVEYIQKICGKVVGSVLAFFYLLYFTYAASRVLRDFGDMLVTTAYRETPLFIINSLLILVVVYSVHKGIEVLARTGELLFVLLYLLGTFGLILVVLSGLIDLNNLKPVLEEGVMPIAKVAVTQSIYIPFGEAIVFSMILPYLNKKKNAIKVGILALGISGVNLALVMAINISVLGISVTSRSQFPLLGTVQSIQIADFLERLDVFFLLGLIICGYFKIGIFLYAAVTGIASLFNIKEPSRLVYPMGLVILLLSIIIASSFAEHLEEGLKIYPIYVLLPFQIIIPLLLLFIAALKNRWKQS